MAHKPNYAHPQVDTPIDKILIPIAFPIVVTFPTVIFYATPLIFFSTKDNKLIQKISPESRNAVKCSVTCMEILTWCFAQLVSD
jgi:hypothetical protein